MKKIFTLTLLFVTSITFAQGSFAWGAKGGLAIGFQQWNTYQRNPLLKYQGDIYIETYDDADANALFAQAGYHVRGSALRNRTGTLFTTGLPFRLPTYTFEFYNVALTTGFKQRFDAGDRKAYYIVGLRGEYTLGTNLSEYDNNNFGSRLYFPFDDAVRKFNYGLTAGAGMEFMFSELVGGIIEFSISPDLSYQYKQPQINSVVDPFTGVDTSIPEKSIRNMTAEITIGLRFLTIVEYID